MSTDWKSTDAKCPFYIKEDMNSITCEGLVYNFISTHRFRCRFDKDKQKHIFCNDKFHNCEFYNCLMKTKYSEDNTYYFDE